MSNLEQILTIIISFSASAKLIVNLTPTPKDDVWFAKIYKVVEGFAGIITKKAKESPDVDSTKNST